VKYVTRQGETPASYELNSYLRLAKLPGIEGIWQGTGHCSTPTLRTTPRPT
jgi:hypothetical protein